MLEEITKRQLRLGLSTRKLAQQLDVSPTLLSLVLNNKRPTSSDLKRRIRRWLNTPMADGGHNHPNTVYKKFMTERASFVSVKTLRYYTEKLEPFILWCEMHEFADMTLIKRSTICAFLAYIRLGRRKHGNAPLNNGAIKLHHQTLKTLFNYTAETRSMQNEWINPVSAIKVKHGDAARTEYSDHELSVLMEIIERNNNQVLLLRNKALVTVLLNSALRVSELLSLQVSDVQKNGHLNVSGKGGKRRVVTVGTSGKIAIDKYLDLRSDSRGYMWTTLAGTRLTRKGLQQVFNHVKFKAPTAFPDGLYAHRFRHTSITRLLRARVPLRSVQRYAQAIDVDEAIAAIENISTVKTESTDNRLI